MDSARKRKASNATTSAEGASGTSKRIKLLNSNPAPSSDVQRIGQKLLNQLHNATDKTGRSVADAFLELPSPDEYADYYRQIRMPVAISTIEEKLKQNAYPTVTTLESDVKRMIQNAKEYNMPKSDVYEDAERIRKLVYNFMKVHNPAYTLDPNYTSFPTPIPDTKLILTNGGHRSDPVKHEPSSRDGSVKPRLSLAPKNSEPPSERKSSVALSAVTGDGGNEDMDFTGKSFQEAQEMIVAELIRHTDDEGLEIFTPFVNLPTRKLEDYYKVIRHPVSIKSVQKRIRGIHGRNPPTNITDFKTWDAFEQEVSFIWNNAKQYNEDGSEMYNLANEFEEHFRSRLSEAKEKVDEPAKPSIKLGGPKPQAKSGITLNLSQHRNSPTPGVTVDSEALLRQRQMVQAGVNGQQAQHRPTVHLNGSASRTSHVPPLEPRPSSGTTAGSPHAMAVKNERFSGPSPAPSNAPAVQPIANGMMPPPLARLPTGGPLTYPSMPQATSYHYTAPALLPPTQIRSYSVSQALLPVITIATHPQLKVSQPLKLAIPPHATLSHQSTTVTLPSTHYYLQIAPTISRDLSMGRAYKMFVTVNGTRLTQRDTQSHADTGKRTHMYEGSLASGVNRIEVEVAAAKADGNPDSKGLDVEKVTVFANLMKQT